MRILVNYDVKEQNYITVLQYHLRKAGLEAISTPTVLSVGELTTKAKNSGCTGIFLVNEDTLANCVPGEKPTLDDYRGSVLRTSIPIVVGNSLAHTHTVDHGAWLLSKDLSKFKTCFNTSIEFKFDVLENKQMMASAFMILSEAVFIAYDIETKTINVDEDNLIAGDTLITCCSWTAVFVSGKLMTFVLPLLDFGVSHWRTDKEYEDAIIFMRRVNSLNIPKSMHNGMYDAQHSLVYHAEPKNWILDTMGFAHSEFSSLPKSLDFVASLHVPDYIQWKNESEAASKGQDIYRYWQYNALDTFYTARLTIHYLYNLPAYARINYAKNFKLVYPCLYCAFEGILIDKEERSKVMVSYEETMNKELTSLRTILADKNFNPSSPKQVQEYVYDVLGATDPHIGKKVGVSGKKVRNTRSTNEKNMKACGAQHPLLFRVTDKIISYRESRKAVSTYFGFLQKNDRLLYSLDPFGTDTSRMAARSSSFWCGTQIQNIPSYAKSMLIAEDGFMLYERDKSQSEARCTAYLSQDLKLIAALENKEKDFYKTLGFLFFNIPYEKVTTEFRNKVLKKIVHGTNYVMGAATFIENIGIGVLLEAAVSLGVDVTMSKFIKPGQLTLKDFAQSLLDAYHKPFFRVREWYGEVKSEISSTNMLKSPLGHTRYFFGDISKDHNIQRSAIAHGPQNLSVSILNEGFWNAWELTKKSHGDFRLKAQIHDSVLVQIRIGRDDLVEKFAETMDYTAIVHGRKLVIPSDAKHGIRWKEA